MVGERLIKLRGASGWALMGVAITALVLWALAAAGPAHGRSTARSAAAACRSNLSATRDPANPLGLSTAPGANPLSGAQSHLYIEGPAYGVAAQAIASEIGGMAAGFSKMTWAEFARLVASQKLSAAKAHRVSLLEKIASRPETFKLTSYNRGGGPGQTYQSIENYLCRLAPGDVAVLTTYFLKHQGNCKSNRETASDQAVFKRRVDETARALSNFPFVMFSEFDAVGTAGCLSKAGLAERVALLKYQVDKFSALPHGVIYAEGGESDANTAAFAAKILNAEGIGKIRGFFLGDTHEAWTSNEIKLGNQISRLTHGAPFVVSTQANGQGPLLNKHPAKQGVEQLCNPPRRGLGPQPTTDTGFPLVDAFEWVTTPGRSGGQCHPGDPATGTFGENLALSLASRANGKIGPGYPSRPY